MKKFIFLPFVISLFSIAASGQRMFGISTSNWSGISGIYLNPANAADNRDHITIDIFSVNAGVDNNLGTINTSGGINSFVNRLTSSTSGGTDNIFNYSGRSTFSLVAPYAEVRGPGFMISINRKHTIALTTRMRLINQFNNFDQSLYHLIANPSTAASGNNININAKNFNWTAQYWNEIGLTYGVVLLERGKHQLKGGITARYLGGYGFITVKGNNLNAGYVGNKDSLYATNTDIEYASNILSSGSAFTNGFTGSNLPGDFLSLKDGHGMGADIGLVYEYQPDTTRSRYDMDGKTGIIDGSKNRYKLRISASVTDIGVLSYSNNVTSTATITGNGYITGDGLSKNVTDFNSFKNYALNQGFRVDTGNASRKLYLPTALLLSADYNVYRWIYVNASYINNLVNRSNYGNSVYNQVTVTPRYDTRLFSFGLPITYSMLANDVKVGVGIRFTGFFIGSDDMLAFFGGKNYGANVYMGGFVPIGSFKPRDRDGDHVSDRKDQCPDVYGTWERHGCPEPDAEHGGSKDEE